MTYSDFATTFLWWAVLFIIGISCLPISLLFFSNFIDKGYIFAKIAGIIFLSYIIFLVCILHVLPFTMLTTFIALIALCSINLYFFRKHPLKGFEFKKIWKLFLFEEILFFSGVFFWSFVRGTQPDIHGLEKYMDFGFVNSILRSTYFPPSDMWYPPFPINYYYFGHLSTAVLTKFSGIPSNISFNLMLATLFSFTLLSSFSLAINLLYLFFVNQRKHMSKQISSLSPMTNILIFFGGFLTSFITTFGGNLHTVYLFFKPYNVDNPVPFWQLTFAPQTFPNTYWYPNATRFIFHTIHEFPIYSFVVSDLHGHVLDIPFVFFTLAVLLIFFLQLQKLYTKYFVGLCIFVGFLLAVMYMTNAWDGIIYLLLTGSMIIILLYKRLSFTKYLLFLLASFFVFSFPFSLFFKPFASQIGILCAPSFLTTLGHIGPFLFEANHCQHSPWWQLLILHGFFLYWIIGFIIFLFYNKKTKSFFSSSDVYILFISGLSILLILIPEFVYLKDIYPAHYRANTMFKLVYQAFLMLALASGYSMIRILTNKKIMSNIYFWLYKLVGLFLFCFVAIYPYFAINSYYGNLQTYYGLDGTTYLKKLYPTDYNAILWLNTYVPNQPVILEAQGDSYTDYGRVSSNTGLPTPLGWTVHEWLWRGSYDPLPPRISDIQTLYETQDIPTTINLLKKYKIKLVFIGSLERQKYTNLNEQKFIQLGKLLYQNGKTAIYAISL